jgi:hypothetical protein
MSEHSRTTDGPGPESFGAAGRHGADDELVRQITRALRSRDDAQPDATVVAARIEAHLASTNGGASRRRAVGAELHSSRSDLTRRGGTIVVAGVVLSALAVAGAGAAAATYPYSGVARAVENVAQAVGIEWSAMPDGYTREQYEAFWGAGYTADDVQTLGELWSVDATETKARAGQLILDGSAPPLAPGGSDDGSPTTGDDGTTGAYTQAQAEAFWGAGYTDEDLEALIELWDTEVTETKARAGQMLLDGVMLPLAPSDPGSATE